MLPPRRFYDPQYLRSRAEEMRTHAEEMNDPAARELMLANAESYDRLADLAEKRIKQKNGNKGKGV